MFIMRLEQRSIEQSKAIGTDSAHHHPTQPPDQNLASQRRANA
jgi:hypothetical protein